MYFETFNELLAMGGHGLYVWLAYGVTALVLVANYVAVRSAMKRCQERLRWQHSDMEQDEPKA